MKLNTENFKSTTDLGNNANRMLADSSLSVFLDYEIRSSWWASWIGWSWGQELSGRYFAWKVKRKYARYKQSKVWEQKNLHKAHISGNEVTLPFDKVTRLEVISYREGDKSGRVFTHWKDDNKIEGQLQDKDRTLKIFIDKR